MPRPNVKGQKRQRKMTAAPGYRPPYWDRHRYVTSTLTNEEHGLLKARAEEAGLKTTPFATKIIRDFLAKPINPDDFEDSPNVYADETDDEAVS